ncbi:MAG: aminotransferase class I/II-fold pyridoxal phosphate-dependent enzyme [Oscillospiraceae bacterium]|nr:aminotransferase class I/II-fold pyridoxal phosphate-dependent enzyme [Oscillospiraceae bacterium]
MSKRIFLSSPTMNGSEKAYIDEAFRTNWIAPLGANVDGFEKELCEYLDPVGFACALVSGTSAIHLALKLAGIDEGDRVFCSSLTFSASANPIVYEKAIPVFIDSETESWNMSPEALEKAFIKYPDTKAVIAVNLYGTPAKLDEISDICTSHNAVFIEDAAESLGARYKSRQTGTFGRFSAFSFNGNKIITTSGGGMLFSYDENAVKKARFWATQSRDPARHYQHSEIGYNYRMSNIVAGIGRGQLKTLDEFISRKKAIRDKYLCSLSGLPELTLNPVPAYSEPNYWLTSVTVDKSSKITPDDIINTLNDDNIESRPIWKPMHLQPVFTGMDYITAGKTSVSDDIFTRGVCLPSDIKMDENDMERVTQRILKLFGK